MRRCGCDPEVVWYSWPVGFELKAGTLGENQAKNRGGKIPWMSLSKEGTRMRKGEKKRENWSNFIRRRGLGRLFGAWPGGHLRVCVVHHRILDYLPLAALSSRA